MIKKEFKFSDLKCLQIIEKIINENQEEGDVK